MRLKKVKGAYDIIKDGTYYLDNPKHYRGKWHQIFNNNNPIYIEIGMGKGKFIIENALKYPHINYIGIEKFDSVIVRAIQKSNDLDIPNLKLIRIDAKEIEEVFDHEIDLIYLNFSDPWPKERHAKRRLTSSIFLSKYDLISKNNPHIIMKTDNNNLFNYSLETLKENGYQIEFITNNLHQISDLLEEPNIMTEYEEKFVNQGIKINKLEAIKYTKK